MSEFVRRYRKFFVAAAAGLAALIAALSDGSVSGDEIVVIISAILGPLGVAWIPNAPQKTTTTRGTATPPL
jgi:hypothetical protein